MSYSKKELLISLSQCDIPFVIIGGMAMRFYNSPRVTQDLDLAVRAVDIDAILKLLYENSKVLVTNVTDNDIEVIPDVCLSHEWVERENPGSLSFIDAPPYPVSAHLSFSEIKVTTQVDFLYELAVPFMRLKERASVFSYEGISLYVASPEDLLYLKEKRSDRSSSDEYDIDFINENLLK